MTSHCRCVAAALIGGVMMIAMAHAAELRPAVTGAVGPWEIVVWVLGTRVQQCTLVRAAPAAGEPKFGILIDSQGGVLSVETTAWSLTPKVPVAATLVPSVDGARRMKVEPVSTSRANVRFAPEGSLLDQLQHSDYFELRVGAATVRVGVDDFNAARIVLDACVQKVGTKWRSATDD